MLLVYDLMSTQPLTLMEDASVGRAHAEMKLARIRHFPVVNEQEQVVGILSSLDVARALAVKGYGKTLPIAKVMSTKVQTIAEDVPAYRAARIMREQKVGALPVVDDVGKLSGIITEGDFLRVAEQALLGKRLTRAPR